MDFEKEYKHIKSFAIAIFTLTGIFISVILYFTHRDVLSLKKEYTARLEMIENKVVRIADESKTIIQTTETRSVKELERIKNSAENIAKEEALNRVSEAFKYGNIEQMIEHAAKEAMSEKVDELIERKLKETEKELNDLVEISIQLNWYLEMMTNGDREGLKKLEEIIEKNPYSDKASLARKIIQVKGDDYREYYNNNVDLDKYLNDLTIDESIRSDSTKLAILLVDKILADDVWLHDIAANTLALEKLGFGPFRMFDLEAIKELQKKLNNK